MNVQKNTVRLRTARGVRAVLPIAFAIACSSEPAADTSLQDLPALSALDDPGYSAFPRWHTDVDGNGTQDYCRFVGSYPDVFLSCALRAEDGSFPDEYAYNSIVGIERGEYGEQSLVDVNGDGGLDYCRLIGDARVYKQRLTCNLATSGGFEENQFGFNSPNLRHMYNSWGNFVDDNGDGMVDWCMWMGTAGGPLWDNCCVHNEGDGFGPERCFTIDDRTNRVVSGDRERGARLGYASTTQNGGGVGGGQVDNPINQPVDARCACRLNADLVLRQDKRLCFSRGTDQALMYASADEQCRAACVRVANNNWQTDASAGAALESFSVASGDCTQSLDSFEFPLN